MRIFPDDNLSNLKSYYSSAPFEGSGTYTGCGHSYGADDGSGFGRGQGNYPHQLIQYWK